MHNRSFWTLSIHFFLRLPWLPVCDTNPFAGNLELSPALHISNSFLSRVRYVLNIGTFKYFCTSLVKPCPKITINVHYFCTFSRQNSKSAPIMNIVGGVHMVSVFTSWSIAFLIVFLILLTYVTTRFRWSLSFNDAILLQCCKAPRIENSAGMKSSYSVASFLLWWTPVIGTRT